MKILYPKCYFESAVYLVHFWSVDSRGSFHLTSLIQRHSSTLRLSSGLHSGIWRFFVTDERWNIHSCSLVHLKDLHVRCVLSCRLNLNQIHRLYGIFKGKIFHSRWTFDSKVEIRFCNNPESDLLLLDITIIVSSMIVFFSFQFSWFRCSKYFSL